jgi:hypothetical protein
MIPAAAKQKIEAALGDQDAHVLETFLDVLWGLRDDKDAIWPDLREQYVIRDGIDTLLGQVWKQVQVETPETKTHLEQKAKALLSIRETCEAEIQKMEGFARQSRDPVVAQITTTAPRMPGDPLPPLCGPPDPNDPRFRGDPVARTSVPDAPMFE